MKELDPLILLAVFHEMLGFLLWLMFAVVFGAGLIGTTILAYTAIGWLVVLRSAAEAPAVAELS